MSAVTVACGVRHHLFQVVALWSAFAAWLVLGSDYVVVWGCVHACMIEVMDKQVPKRTNSQKLPKKRPSRHSKFDVPGRMRETLESAGVPWFWLHNAWEGRLQVNVLTSQERL